MITCVQQGFYKLIETKDNTKILYLDDKTYAWVEPPKIGELLVYSHKQHRTDCALSMGHYRLYNVKDEPALSDLRHLELEYGENAWQGYLLLTGLPNELKTRARIVPTYEIITTNPRFKLQTTLHKNDAKGGSYE